MSKEHVNYHSSSSVVVKRSPAGRSSKHTKHKSLAGSVLAQSKKVSGSSLGKSMSQNISSLNKVLTESEKIMPRTCNTLKSQKGLK